LRLDEKKYNTTPIPRIKLSKDKNKIIPISPPTVPAKGSPLVIEDKILIKYNTKNAIIEMERNMAQLAEPFNSFFI
jgi:hypothetical protein